MSKTKKALIVMDFINEIVHPEGKFKGKGYADFVSENKVIDSLNHALKLAREKQFMIIFVKVGFTADYINQPKNSLLFGKANDFKALTMGTWATDILSEINIEKDDVVVIKHRISPFYGTSLDVYLRNNKIEDVYLCGVATDLVVESAARDSHDRDFNVYVVADCCGAGSSDDHKKALNTLQKIAKVCNSEDI